LLYHRPPFQQPLPEINIERNNPRHEEPNVAPGRDDEGLTGVAQANVADIPPGSQVQAWAIHRVYGQTGDGDRCSWWQFIQPMSHVGQICLVVEAHRLVARPDEEVITHGEEKAGSNEQ